MKRLIRFIFSTKFLPAMRSIVAEIVFSVISKSRIVLVYLLRSQKMSNPIEVPYLLNLELVRKRRLRVAVVRFDGLGDTALTLPLLEGLASNIHVNEVVFFSPEKVAFALKGFYSGSIIPVKPFSIHYPRFKISWLSSLFIYSGFGAYASWILGRKARNMHGKFDLVVLPRWDHDLDLNTRFYARGLGGYLLGHNPKWIENANREESDVALLDLICNSPDRAAHEFDHSQKLASLLGINLTKHMVGSSASMLTPTSTVFFQMGAAMEKRVWRMENWCELASIMVQKHPGWRFVVNPAAETDFSSLLEYLGPKFSDRFVKLQPTNAGELFEQLSKSSLYIGSDTGPLHLSEFLNIKSVVISCHPMDGRTDHVNSSARFGNSPGLGIWLGPSTGADNCSEGCTAVSSHCINLVTPQVVCDAIDNFSRTNP